MIITGIGFDKFFHEAQLGGPYISAPFLRNYLEHKAQEWLDMSPEQRNNPLNLGAYNFCRACLDDLNDLIKGGH